MAGLAGRKRDFGALAIGGYETGDRPTRARRASLPGRMGGDPQLDDALMNSGDSKRRAPIEVCFLAQLGDGSIMAGLPMGPTLFQRYPRR
jgi:hypothetical protein